MPHPLIALIVFLIADIAIYRTLREALHAEIAYLRLRRGGTRLQGQVIGHDPRAQGGRNSHEYRLVPKVRYSLNGKIFEATVENYGGDLIAVGNGMDLVVDAGYPDQPFAIYMSTAAPAALGAFAALLLFTLLAVAAAASLR